MSAKIVKLPPPAEPKVSRVFEDFLEVANVYPG